jgi:hypothetical protein
VLRIRDWVFFWPLDPGWEKVSIRIRDDLPGSYFFELRNHFFGFFGIKLLILRRGSGIRDGVSSDPGFWIRDGKKSDPGSGIKIPDPPHCLNAYHCTILLRFFCLRYPTELKKLIVTTVRTKENLKLLGDSKNETNYLKHKLWLSIVDSVNRVRFLLLFFYFVREFVCIKQRGSNLQDEYSNNWDFADFFFLGGGVHLTSLWLLTLTAGKKLRLLKLNYTTGSPFVCSFVILHVSMYA